MTRGRAPGPPFSPGVRSGTRNAAPILALVAALLLSPALFAEDSERVPGTVTLSDGTVLDGLVRTTRGKPLRIVESDTGRRLDFNLDQIKRIRVHVTLEEQVKKWRWVEDGSREKVETGETFPKREFETEVVLRTGQVHRGTSVTVLYVYEEGREKPKKAFLRKQHVGDVGKTLEDLVHVESVEFGGEEPDAAAAAMLSLEVAPAEALVTAHAMPRGRDRSQEGIRTRTPGRAMFPGLLPGTYDLALVTPDRILVALAVGESGGKTPSEAVLAELRSRVAEIPDFFEIRELLFAVREGKKVRALVRKTRTGKTSMGGDREFRRWEIWSMHKGGDRWLVDTRSYVWREHGEDLPPPRDAVLTPALGGAMVSTGLKEVRFTVPGKDER